MSAGDIPARWVREEGECPCSRELREHGTVTKRGPAKRLGAKPLGGMNVYSFEGEKK